MMNYPAYWIRRSGENFMLLFKIRDEPIQRNDQFNVNPNSNIRVGIRKPINPLKLLANLQLDHWLAFLTGFIAFYADFLDFNVLAAATKKIAAYYGTTKAHVSDGITYTMALRVIGAIIFGILGDLYGRRWPLIANLIILGSLQIASIYCNSIGVFLGIRALFGVGMGGCWSLSASFLTENCPIESRGILAGMFQSSVACSSLTAAGLNMAFGADPKTWKKMFWVSCGISYFAAFVRFIVPESKQFREAAKKKKDYDEKHFQDHLENNHNQKITKKGILGLKEEGKIMKFKKQFFLMLKDHWQTFIYSAAFVTLASWAVHSYADNYVTFMISGKGFSNRTASVISMITKSGCIIGMSINGWLGEFLGRRRVAAFATIMAAGLLPASIIPNSKVGLCIGGWFYQFFFESFGCVVASHLQELAPVTFRAFMPGVAYQLGTSISAPSAMIVNDIAEDHHVYVNGKRQEAYEPVIGVTMAICYFFMILLVLFGPERRGADLEHFTPPALLVESQQTLNEPEDSKKSATPEIQENVNHTNV